MKGLELSRRYFDEIGEPFFSANAPELMDRMAFGLCGEGSECFGYDDEHSRDHDFGPAFCVWVTDDDYLQCGEKLQRIYKELPDSFMGFEGRNTTSQGGGRVGIIRISDYYRKFTGLAAGPSSNIEWFRIPEHLLAQASNGEIFRDSSGEFSSIHSRLLAFYPEEVQRKKIAARALTMAQAGQYNYPRSIRRSDPGAAFFALSKFTEAAISMAHLLEKKYTPYYKWSWRSMQELAIGKAQIPSLRYMMNNPMDPGNVRRVEQICIQVKEEWMRQGLTQMDENYLEPQAWQLYQQITDPELRRRSIMEG